MTRARVGLVLAVLSAVAIWGCAQNPSKSKAQLQEEIHNLTGVRDRLQGELKTAKGEVEQLKAEVQALRRERDEMQNQLAARTAERDAQSNALDQLRKGLRALMDQAEAAVPSSTTPISTAASKPARTY